MLSVYSRCIATLVLCWVKTYNKMWMWNSYYKWRANCALYRYNNKSVITQGRLRPLPDYKMLTGKYGITEIYLFYRPVQPPTVCQFKKKSVSIYRGRRVIGISGSLIWSKTLLELIFNPCGEFRWSPEGPFSQIHSPHLLVGATRIFWDLLRFV